MIHFPPFRFDPASGELTKGGRSVKLHPQPAALLGALVARPGELVSRDDIRQAVWGDETHVDFDLGINSCIRQVRTALGDDADQPRFIETVPRKGYRFIAPVSEPVSRRRWAVLGVGVAVAALIVWNLLSRPPRPAPPAAEVAVFPFDNLTEQAEHDWLRQGVAELVVTSLSRDSAGKLLPPEHLYEALENDDVLHLVERTGVRRVVLGSYAISGSTLRFNVRVQDAVTGAILETVVAEGDLDGGVFPIVDRLTMDLAPALEMSLSTRAGLTTTSEEAYRLYVRAQALRWTGGAAELYRKAIEIDPNFAEALARLASVHYERGENAVALDYTERAMAHVDRLAPIERYDLEGRYYTLTRNWSRALEAYRRLQEINPLSHLLANRLKNMERHEEGVENLEAVIERGAAYPDHPSYNYRSSHGVLALNYFALERFDDGYRILEYVRERFPERPMELIRWVGLVTEGRFQEARQLGERIERLGMVEFPLSANAAWLNAILEGDYEDAREQTERLLASEDPYARWSGLYKSALLELYRGDTSQAHRFFDEAGSVFDEPNPLTVQGQSAQARLLLDSGELEQAAAVAREALAYPWSELPKWDALVTLSLSHAQLGEWRSAEENAEKLRAVAESFPSHIEMRRYHYLLGELARIRGDLETAVSELEQAANLLPPRGHFRATLMEVSAPHVPIWFALARAYLAVDRPDDARAYLKRIQNVTFERAERPLEFLRSRELLRELGWRAWLFPRSPCYTEPV